MQQLMTSMLRHPQQRSLNIALILVVLTSFGATAATLPQETVTLHQDKLAVTLASANVTDTDPFDSDFTIWVGQIDLDGKKVIWVELIDSYGEVIYDSEVGANETHLLPDGRAVVVSSIIPEVQLAKRDQSRIESDGPLMVTRRIVEEGDQTTAIEFIETAKERPASRSLQFESLGKTLWNTVFAFFDTAASHVEVTWSWLVDTIRA
ncbi:hypothetical protein [Roseibium algae]|uniref:Uncharacterized protein n=1 Tax=Roseibium algae TaxID=3123038 RepID=A0ABU8TL85_9HYPH